MTNREIDALVAEKVFGRETFNSGELGSDPCLRGLNGGFGYLPNYSTYISAAWQVVEKMREIGIYMAVECIDYGPDKNITNGFYAYCWRPKVDPDHKHVFGTIFAAKSPTAICLAALKALGIEASETKESLV